MSSGALTILAMKCVPPELPYDGSGEITESRQAGLRRHFAPSRNRSHDSLTAAGPSHLIWVQSHLLWAKTDL
jgi:hypothetical protein